MMMPSAPPAKAFSRSMKSMRPVHGKRTISTFEAYLIRLVPVKSAPAYVHQLHTNAMMRGSKLLLFSSMIIQRLFVKQGGNFGVHLLVGITLYVDGFRAAERYAGTASLTESRIDFCHH